MWLLKKDDMIWFWEEGYRGEEIYSEDFFMTKLKYIHMNPVRAGIVLKEEEYINSFVVIIMELELDHWFWKNYESDWKSSLSSFAMSCGTCRRAD